MTTRSAGSFSSTRSRTRRRSSSISSARSTARNSPPLTGAWPELVIGNIDDNGFLQTTPEEMNANTGVAVPDPATHPGHHPEFPPRGRRRGRPAGLPADPASQARQGEHPGISDHQQTPRRTGQTPVSRDCAAPWRERRPGADRRLLHRHAGPETGCDFCTRPEQLRPARRERGKDRRKIHGHAQRRADPPPAHLQHVQGPHGTGRAAAAT